VIGLLAAGQTQKRGESDRYEARKHGASLSW
jgi:hypothetical protein